MLPKSKSNRITVESQRFHYIVAESGTARDKVVPLTVNVQHEQNGARLRVTGVTTCRVPEVQSKFYMGRTVNPNVVPRHIAKVIELALSRGWTPLSPGPTFTLEVTNSDVFAVSAVS